MADLDNIETDDLPAADRIEMTRADIEQTRGEMAETLNAIKEKLDPKMLMDEAKQRVEEVAGNLADKAKDTVHTVVTDVADHAKEAAHNAVTGAVDEAKEVVDTVVHSAKDAVGGAMDTAKGAGSSVVQLIKGNPLPSALIALGAAWLYMKKRDHDSTYRYTGDYGYPNDANHGGSRSFVDASKEKVGQAAEAVGDAANAVKDKAGEVFDSAKETVGGAMGTVKDAGVSIIDTIERNPIPAAATALGLVWLYLKNQDDNKGRRSQADVYDYSLQNQFGSTGSTGNGSENVVGKVKEKAGEVGEAVGSAVESVKQKAGEVTSQARDKAGELRSQAGGAITRTLQENPLPIGMVALGLGAAVGMLLPETEQEHRLMGRARDHFMEQAQSTAQDLTEKVKTVAGQAVDAAKETAQHVARDQGLTKP